MSLAAQTTALIAALEQLGPNDHFCSIYESPREHYAVAIPFMRIGLDRDEKCIYIADDGTVGDVREAMQSEGIDVDRAIASKALVLTTKEQAYLQHGSFHPEWVFTFWKEAEQLAVSEGFSALRVTGETEWVLRGGRGLERWMEYESKMTHNLSESNCSALCQYNLRVFPPELILDVIRTHPVVVYGGTVCRNLYYVPPDEFLGTNQTAREMERLLTNIQERERVEVALREQLIERQRAEEAWRESEERWRAVFDNSAAGIALANPSGCFLAGNLAYQKMLGYSEKELRELSFLDITHEDYRDANSELTNELLEGKRQYFEMEKRYRRKDGNLIWVRVHVSLVSGKQITPRFLLAIVDNITERKRAEEALRDAQMELAHVTRVATLGEMTASIAHEINQPLGALVNNAGACLGWLDSENLEEARNSVALVMDDARRASEIITRIRALVKKTPPQKDWLDINQIIREVIALAQSEVQRNRITLETQLSDNVPPILADRIQLQQVMLNLMMNAIEAMTQVTTPRELLISSEADDSKGVVVVVRDSGPGLDSKSLERLFEPFYTTKPQGMGMGLAICRSIIQAHGGRLWATANSDCGACFHFALPTDEEPG